MKMPGLDTLKNPSLNPTYWISKTPAVIGNLDKIAFSNIKKLMDTVIPKKERRQSEIIINYIRIYTYLNNCLNLLDKDGCKRGIEHLLVAKNAIRQVNLPEEKPYLKRISDILDFILKNKKAVMEELSKDEASDPFHAKTSVQLAQNICILRILKISKY